MSFVFQQPGRFEHLQVPGGRGPRMLEHVGDLASGHCSAVEMHRHEYSSACRMGECRKHRLVSVLLALGFPFFCHRFYLAQLLNKDKKSTEQEQ